MPQVPILVSATCRIPGSDACLRNAAISDEAHNFRQACRARDLQHGPRTGERIDRTTHKENVMSNTLRKVDYFYVMVPNTAGQGAKIMDGLAQEGVNLLAFSGFPSGRKAQLDLMPQDAALLKRAAKKLGLKLSIRKTGFLYQGDDRVGAMTAILDKLAGAKINVVAIDAVTSGDGRFGAIFWVTREKVAKAAKLLGAS